MVLAEAVYLYEVVKEELPSDIKDISNNVFSTIDTIGIINMNQAK